MSPSDLATLSLLDPDQGVCPSGHPCRVGDAVDAFRPEVALKGSHDVAGHIVIDPVFLDAVAVGFETALQP